MSARKSTAEEQFWNWFTQHELEFFHFDPKDRKKMERLFESLAGELQKVDEDLTFEFGPNQPRRELVISAGGIKRAFPAVTALVGAAPNLERWDVIAFRPRRPPGIVEFAGKRVDPKDVQFTLLDNGKIAGLHLFIPGFREDDIDLKQIGYLLLDESLGEYDVESRLGLIKMMPTEARISGERYPFADLPALFDELVAHLENRPRKPS